MPLCPSVVQISAAQEITQPLPDRFAGSVAPPTQDVNQQPRLAHTTSTIALVPKPVRPIDEPTSDTLFRTLAMVIGSAPSAQTEGTARAPDTSRMTMEPMLLPPTDSQMGGMAFSHDEPADAPQQY